MIEKRKIVVFDLDDTLYKEIDFLKSAYRHIASLVSNAQVSAEKIYQLMWVTYQQKGNAFEVAVRTFGFHLYTVDWMINVYRHHQPNITLDEETRTTLMRLKNDDAVLGIISDGRMITQTNKIRALGLERYIGEENVIINEVEERFKPDLKSFHKFLERYGKDSEYWYIGDNTSKDFKAPNSLGWITVCLLNDGRNIHQQDFSKNQAFMPRFLAYHINDIIDQEKLVHVLNSPLDIEKTAKRYALDNEKVELLKEFDATIWRTFSFNSVDDVVAFEKKYQEFSKDFNFVHDSLVHELGSVDMEDGPMCLLSEGRFQQFAEGLIQEKTGLVFLNAGLSLLETLVIKTFLADLSGMYRLDAYYYGVPPFAKQLCHILNNALSKLPYYSKWVVRKCHKYDRADFSVGEVFCPGFCLTTSSDINWKEKSKNRYRIKPLGQNKTKARAIFKVRDNSEKQVSFLQDAKFLIKEIRNWGKGKKEIVMEEIE